MRYQITVDGVDSSNLEGGFFEGWPNPPTPEAHLRILRGSAFVVLAISNNGNVVGFITAISDGVSCAYIPHLEVLPPFRGNGIGTELVRQCWSYSKIFIWLTYVAMTM
jgi:ribosomal protein S18 acetylase RimI-like enzyme